MNILEISKQPTCIRLHGIGVHVEGNGYHESVLRAWNILAKVKELLELNTPQSVIIEMIAVMESVKYPDTNDLEIYLESSEVHGQRLLAELKAKRPDLATVAHDESGVSDGG